MPRTTDQIFPSRRCYIESPEGQIHARCFGPKDGPPVVLLHWTPGSGAMLSHIGTALGALGYAAWALDLLGYGQSDTPQAEGWSQVRHGNALAAALRGAGLKDVTLMGGHMGGEVALECAVAAPDLVSRLVLDGIATDWTPAFRQELIAKIGYAPPDYDEAGAPLMWAWEKTLWLWKAWVPGLQVNAQSAPVLHQAMSDLMASGLQPGPMAVAFGAHPSRERLALIRQPVLALTAGSDTLRDQYPSTVQAIPDVRGHVFDGVHPCHRLDGGPDYAAVLHAFISGSREAWLGKNDDLAPLGGVQDGGYAEAKGQQQ